MMRFLGICLLLVTCCVQAAGLEFKTFTLQHRFASDVLPSIQPLVGEEGTAGGLDNHLWIRATPERMQMVEAMINTLDAARKNYRITVSHDTNVQQQGQSAGVSGRGSAGGVEVDIGGPDAYREENGFRVDMRRYERNIASSGSQFITAMDGTQAFIQVGQSVPFTQQWVVLTQRYARQYQSTQFYDITTGFAVRPRSIGNLVELEITPRISSFGQGGVIDFEELSTVVRVAPGSWVDIGGTMQSRDEVSRAILSSQQSAQGQQHGLMIRVDE